MYANIGIDMYTYLYVYAHVYIYMYRYMYIYIYIYTYIHIFIYICIYTDIPIASIMTSDEGKQDTMEKKIGRVQIRYEHMCIYMYTYL
jgi:hypothetical protein